MPRQRTYLIESAHRGAGRRNDVVDEEEEGVFRPQVDALADEEVELAHRQVGRHQVLLLVKVTDASLRRLLHDHLKVKDASKVNWANSEPEWSYR